MASEQLHKRLIIKLSYPRSASQKRGSLEVDDDFSQRDNKKKRVEKPIISCYWLDAKQPLQKKEDTVLSHTQQTNNIKASTTTLNSVPSTNGRRRRVPAMISARPSIPKINGLRVAAARKILTAAARAPMDGDGTKMMIKKDNTKKKPMDYYKKMQCLVIIKRMIAGRDGWAFKTPLDIKFLNGLKNKAKVKPTCLKDIEGKLKSSYSTPDEFADDMRFVFYHGMCYPRTEDVHKVAARLSDTFESKWKDLNKKWAREAKRLKYKKHMKKRNQCVQR